MLRRLTLFLLILIAAGSLTAQNSDAGKLYGFINQYNADAQMLQRKYVIKYSPEYFNRMKRFYTDWLERLKKQPFSTFTASDKVDYLLLKRNIKKDQVQLLADEQQYTSLLAVIPFTKHITSFEAKRRIGQQQPGKEVAQSFVQLKEEVLQTMKQLETGAALS
ncbi:MAG: hypothetical protein KA160_07380, partial [Lacibacter sp.]|nr:hypothetical protein [Lacibacter sp.]